MRDFADFFPRDESISFTYKCIHIKCNKLRIKMSFFNIKNRHGPRTNTKIFGRTTYFFTFPPDFSRTRNARERVIYRFSNAPGLCMNIRRVMS